MLKPILKKIISPKWRRVVNHALGRTSLDEVEIVYQLLSDSSGSKVMVDVGAHHGGSLDEFARNNWRVFAFEPDEHNRTLLEAHYKKYPSVNIDSRAVSNKNRSKIPFYTSDVSAGISTLSSFHESHVESAPVDTVTLETFADDNCIKNVEFLKIDTEGHDLFVLKGAPWDEFKPKVVLCEFEDRKTELLGYDFHELARYLKDKGYHLLVSEWYPIVEYGSKHQWRRFTHYPCELQDEAAWGNIIAINDLDLYEKLQVIAAEHGQRYS